MVMSNPNCCIGSILLPLTWCVIHDHQESIGGDGFESMVFYTKKVDENLSSLKRIFFHKNTRK